MMWCLLGCTCPGGVIILTTSVDKLGVIDIANHHTPDGQGTYTSHEDSKIQKQGLTVIA